MSAHQKTPTEIRRMKALGRYSSAMRHNAETAERTWHDLYTSHNAAAPDLLLELIAACRESVRQFETLREGAIEIGCLLSPDLAWRPPESQ